MPVTHGVAGSSPVRTADIENLSLRGFFYYLQFMLPLIIIGPIFTVTAIITLLFPPKKINAVYGYRTSRSMRNQMAWDTAQKISSRIMLIEGIVFTLISRLMYLIPLTDEVNLVLGLIFLIIGLVVLFVITERKIKNV